MHDENRPGFRRLQSEINKMFLKRPCLVLQNDVGNATSTTTIVASITSELPSRRYPFQVWLPDTLLKKPSVVLCEQIRTVATERFDAEVLGVCPETVMEEVERAIRVSLGLAREL